MDASSRCSWAAAGMTCGSPTARFQPLRHIDDPLRRGIAIQWLLDLMEEYHVPVTAHGASAYLGTHVVKLARVSCSRADTSTRLLTLHG